MNKGALIGGVIAIVLIAGGILVFGNTDDDSSTSTTQPETTSQTNQSNISQQTSSTETSAEDGSSDEQQAPDQELTIDMSNFAFSVDQIDASPGDTIKINLTNSGGTHNLFLDEFGVASDTVNTGGTTSVTFTVPEDASGDYEYYCSVGSHRELGMVGTLSVN